MNYREDFEVTNQTCSDCYEDVDVTATLFGTSEVSVAAFEMEGGKYVTDKAPEWMTITLSNFNTADGASVLQEREVMISVSENNSDERSAIILFVPHSLNGKADTFLTEDKSAVKEEYQSYAVPVSQLSNKFVITISSTDEEMADAGASFVEASAEKKSELAAAFGETDNVYVLTYDNIYALDAARMMMSREFADVKVYDNTKVDQSAVEDFWLAFNYDKEAKNSGVVEMYFNSDPAEVLLPVERSTGYVVFYDESASVLAIIECISPYEDEIVTPPGDVPQEDEFEDISSSFVNKSASLKAGAELRELVAGPTYEAMKEETYQGARVWYLTLPSLNSPIGIKLPKACKYYQMPYLSSGDYPVSVNGENYSTNQGTLASAIRTAEIEMKSHPESETYQTVVRFHEDRDKTFPFLVLFISVKE